MSPANPSMSAGDRAPGHPPGWRNPSNRLGLDYAAEASRLGPPPTPIVDVHTHVNGRRAAQLLLRACDLYGVERVYSMTAFEQADDIRAIFGNRIRFIAIPDWWAKEDRRHVQTWGYVDRIAEWHERGARIAKFWTAPRSIDTARELGDPNLLRLDSPSRLAALEAATRLGMVIMAHIADPDTWFSTKYCDASIYGAKRDHYIPLERMLDRFTQPWIVAHMGGWPENLDFLAGLLDRHPNLNLDTSACKWQVREWSKHPRDRLAAFFQRFRGRILFGSDIVTADDHLDAGAKETEMQRKAASEHEAFDLYASRYWAYRTMLETDFEGESPIADPDLAMIDPSRHTEQDAPVLRGLNLPVDLLSEMYGGAARRVLGPLDP
jgi:predicted TIM-barrel fold metal-dependent hydrolase